MPKISIISISLMFVLSYAPGALAEESALIRNPATATPQRVSPTLNSEVQFIRHLELKEGSLAINQEMIERLQEGGMIVITPITKTQSCPNISCTNHAVCDQAGGYCSCHCASRGGGDNRGNDNRLFDAN